MIVADVFAVLAIYVTDVTDVADSRLSCRDSCLMQLWKEFQTIYANTTIV
jgi:hypothetical protein